MFKPCIYLLPWCHYCLILLVSFQSLKFWYPDSPAVLRQDQNPAALGVTVTFFYIYLIKLDSSWQQSTTECFNDFFPPLSLRHSVKVLWCSRWGGRVDVFIWQGSIVAARLTACKRIQCCSETLQLSERSWRGEFCCCNFQILIVFCSTFGSSY